jgi:hypothetical protein
MERKPFLFVGILIAYLFLSLCAGYAFASEGRGAASGHPVAWTPDRLDRTVVKGTTVEIEAAFVSSVDLQDAGLWVTPGLRPYVAITPERFAAVKAGGTYEVAIRLTAPCSTRPGRYDGTVHLRAGARTYPETLKVRLTVARSGDNIPPVADAGPDQTLVLGPGQTAADVRLDAGGSYDPDGTIAAYTWTGNPDPEDVAAPSLSLKQGKYTFTLVVTDGQGSSSEADTVNVTVLGAPLVAPLPAVTGESSLNVKGLAVPGATVVLQNATRGESKEIVSDTGFFESPLNLAPGENKLRFLARLNGQESVPVERSVIYRPTPVLRLDNVSPASGGTGTILTLTGAGFTPDARVMKVYFKGAKYESEGVVLEAAAGSLKVAVPFIFFQDAEDVRIYACDGQEISNPVTFRIVPAQDPTPGIKGNEAAYQLNLLTIHLEKTFAKLEQLAKPNVPPETWSLIEEDMRRMQEFAETLKGRVAAIPNEEVKSNLDAVFGSELFSLINRQMAQVNEILSHSSTGEAVCNINAVIGILNEVLEPLGTIHEVLDDTEDVLWAALAGNSVACFFGCVPCCVAIPFIYETISTISAIDTVICAVISVVDTVTDFLQAAVPTLPSEWKVIVQGPFPGTSNHILYTNTTSTLSVYANFTNAGFEELLSDRVDLSIDIPDPFGIFWLVDAITGVNIEAMLEEVLGSLVVELTVDLLDIDEIHVTFADVPVPSTVQSTNPSSPLTVVGAGSVRETHTIIAGAGTGTDALDIQAACGSYHYPFRTKCENFAGSTCRAWGTDYPRYFAIEVIDKPVIEGWQWRQTPGSRSCLEVYGKGFSATYGVLKIYWNGELIYGVGDPGTSSFKIYGFDWGHKPGWLEVAVAGQGDRRESPRVFVPKSPDLQAHLSFENPAAYPGDTLYAVGNYFTSYPEDHLLSLSRAGGVQAEINPDRVWYKSRATIWDQLAFTVPDLRAYDGKEFLATLKVGPGPYIASQGTLKLPPFESAGTASADDQDLMVFSDRNSYIRSAAVGDLNGDGINDLVAGAPSAGRDFGHPVGAVYIKFGPVEGTDLLYGNRACKAVNLVSDWDVRILGDIRDVDSGGNTRRIGRSLAIGDLNGDGINDLVLGTSDRDEYGEHRADIDLGYTRTPRHLPGKAYVLYGRADWQREYLLYQDQYDVKFGGDDERELGYQVGAGRIYGQNRSDLVITAPADALNQVPARAYVIQGWNGSLTKKEINLPGDLGLFGHHAVIQGKNFYQYDFFNNTQYIGDGMGKSLAIGDIDGDGLDDIVLGAPQYSQLWSANPWTGLQGALYIFRGGQLSASQEHLYSVDAKTNSSTDYTAVWGPRIRYANELTGFGAAVGIIDLNNDGKGEVVAGAPSALLELQIWPNMLLNENYQSIAEIQENEAGRIYLIDGNNPALSGPKLTADYEADLVVNGSTAISRFGYSLSAADINHDGIKDLLVGAPGRANSSGRVWALYGTPSPFWAGTPGQDLLHLQNRSRYYGDGHFSDSNYYALHGPVSLADGSDYLFLGPQPDQRYYPGFGAFVTAGDLNPYVGDDVLIIDPAAAAPGAPFSGMLYLFYEGTSEYWPLVVRPAPANLPYRDGAQEFVVSGGVKPYTFKWGSCYQTYIGQPSLQTPGPVVCSEDFPLPGNFTVAYGANKASLRVNGAIPADLRSLWLKVTDASGATAVSSIRFVKPEISVSPLRVDFGAVALGYTVNRTITVVNAGYMDLQIEGTALTGSPYIRLAGDPPQFLAPGASWTLTAIFNPEAPGLAEATFTITSNDPERGTLSIPLTGTGVSAPDIGIIGGNLVFGYVPVGSSVYQEITIINNGSADLYISSVAVSGSPAFTITHNGCVGSPLPPAKIPYPAGTCTVMVAFTPTATGPAYGTVTIESNDPDMPVFQGSLSGNGIPPYISVTPEAIDFGSRLTGASLTVRNTSAAETLAWSIGEGLPAWLAVSPASGTLGPGETVQLAVTVDRAGLAPGTHTTTIPVTSNGGNAAVGVSVTVLPPLILSPESASISLCGGEQVFAVTNGTPPYTFELLGPAGRTIPTAVTLTDNGDGTATVAVTACGMGRETGAAPAEAAFTAGSGTWEPMGISLYRRIISGIKIITPARTVSTQCGPAVLTLKVTDVYGSVGTAVLTLEGGNTWSRAYGPAEAFAIEGAADGGYLVAGRTPQVDNENVFDIRITKLSPAGWVEWDKQLSYPAHQGVDEIRRTADGGYILLGSSMKAYEAGPLVVKLDESGNIEWSQVVNGAMVYGATDDQIGETSISAIRQTADGGYILAGTMDIYLRDERRSQSGMILVKLDAHGRGEWWRFYHQGPQSFASIFDIEETAGGYVAVGSAVYDRYSGDAPLPMLAKFTGAGDIEWVQTYGYAGYTSAGFCSVQAKAGGGCVIAGLVSASAGGGGGEPPPGGEEPPGGAVPVGTQPVAGADTGGAGTDLTGGVSPQEEEAGGSSLESHLVVVETDADGAIIWKREYTGVNAAHLAEMRSTDDGGYVVGLSLWPGASPDAEQDAWIVKLSESGAIEWQKAYGAADCDVIYSLRETAGGYVAAGNTHSFGSGHFLGDMWVLKVSPAGAMGCSG